MRLRGALSVRRGCGAAPLPLPPHAVSSKMADLSRAWLVLERPAGACNQRSTGPTTRAGGAPEMSENYRFYVQKSAEARTAREANRPLSHQMQELLQVVRECEARWALEDRIGRV